MADELTDADDERNRYVEALGNGIQYRGYVVIESRVLEDVREHLEISGRELLDKIFSYLRNGGRLAKVTDVRSQNYGEFHFEFHHDMWPAIGSRAIYIETRFKDADELDERMIYIVSVHPPNSVNWN